MRRYRSHLENRDRNSTHRSQHSDWQKDFSHHFGFSQSHRVYICGKGGLYTYWRDIDFIRRRIRETNPHILVLELGSNDLANGELPDDVANRVLHFCRELLDAGLVQYIILCKVVQRRRTRETNREDSTEIDFDTIFACRGQQRIRNGFMYIVMIDLY